MKLERGCDDCTRHELVLSISPFETRREFFSLSQTDQILGTALRPDLKTNMIGCAWIDGVTICKKPKVNIFSNSGGTEKCRSQAERMFLYIPPMVTEKLYKPKLY